MLPLEEMKAKKVKLKVSHYVVMNDETFRRGISRPLMKCTNEHQTQYVMDEVHRRICGMHIGGKSMATRVIRVGYYWPTI